MKKKFVLLNTLISAIAIPSSINLLIFNNATNKVNKIDGKIYDWKYGKIFYSVKGKGEPLLLIHGIGAGENSFEWHRNEDTLSKYYKVYNIDLIGFGKSEKPNMTYTAYLYSELIIDFINDIIKAKTNIIASSLSGAFTIMSYNLEPDLFKKIVLVCPSGIGNTNTQFNKNDKYIRMLINSPVIGTTIYNFISSKKSCYKFLKDNIFFNENNITKEILDDYYYNAHYKRSNVRHAIASFMSNYMNVNIENSICKVQIPLYIIWGKNASLSPISNLEIIKDLKHNLDYAIFDNSKLVPHIESPREFNKICKEFLNS